MSNNVGTVLKGVALVLCAIEALVAIIVGCNIAGSDGGIGVAVIFGGIVISVMSYILLYAFGELVNQVCFISDQLLQMQDSDGGANDGDKNQGGFSPKSGDFDDGSADLDDSKKITSDEQEEWNRVGAKL